MTVAYSETVSTAARNGTCWPCSTPAPARSAVITAVRAGGRKKWRRDGVSDSRTSIIPIMQEEGRSNFRPLRRRRPPGEQVRPQQRSGVVRASLRPLDELTDAFGRQVQAPKQINRA